jgi:Predicted DNA-binding protein with PD1-like DNA-binding motif
MCYTHFGDNMEYKKFKDTYIIRLDIGDEVIECLTTLCEDENISLGTINAIGATDYVKIGLYDVVKKEYISKELTGQMEITSLIGNISTKDDEVYLHMHINVCNPQMQVLGGHLNKCIISATCEIIITTINGSVNRILDQNIGLNLFSFDNISKS